MDERKIVFLTLKNFYLSAFPAQVSEDTLVARAVIKDGLVLDASKEATIWGAKPGDSAKRANRRCPGLETVDFNPDDYVELFERVWTVFASVTPLIEPIDYHQGYLDLTGCERQSRCRNSVELIRLAVRRLFDSTSLHCSWGGGTDKWIARLAADKNCWIHADAERAFLEKVPIAGLAIPEDLIERLRRYGICTVGQLFRVPDSFLQFHLQLPREELQNLKRRDRSCVQGLFPAATLMDKEILLWAGDAEVQAALHHLSERLSRELQSRNLQAGKIQLSLITGRQNIARERKLARPCGTPEILNRLLHEMLPQNQAEPWREIHVTLTNLTPWFRPQADLWQNKHPIHTASERLQRKFGFQTLQSGRDYSLNTPARFAQLVYELRGINLP